jgi:hypothetical protein
MEKKTQFLSMRIPPTVLADLKKQAEQSTRTVAAQVLHYIKEGIKNDSKN